MTIGESIAYLIGESLVPSILLLFAVRLIFKPTSRSGAFVFAIISTVVSYLYFSLNDYSVSNNIIKAFIVFLVIALFGTVKPKKNKNISEQNYDKLMNKK